MHSERIRSNGFKLQMGRFKLYVRKKLFKMRVMAHWNRLSREVLETPSLETSKVRLNGALSHMILLGMSLLIAGGLD